MNGNSTYTGSTTLSADGGTLKLGSGASLVSSSIIVNSAATLELTSSGSLPNDGTLTLNTDGMVNLGTEVQEQIGELKFGSTTQPNGSYGSTLSVADNQNDTYFSGTGVLYVGVEPPPVYPKLSVIVVR